MYYLKGKGKGKGKGKRNLTRLFLEFILLCLFLTHNSTYAEHQYTQIPSETKFINITPASYFLTDKSRELKISDVTDSKYLSEFKQQGSPTYNGGTTKHSHWAKISLNLIGKNGIYKRYLEIGYPSLYKVQLYQFINGEQVTQLEMGSYKPFSERLTPHHNFVFPLEIPANQNVDIYVQVQNDGPVSMPLFFMDQSGLVKSSATQHLGYGIYFGIMFGLAIYNMFIFISIRTRSYLYYTLHLISMAGIGLGLSGFSNQYLWGEVQFLSLHFTIIAGYLSHFAAIKFTQSFLETKKLSPKLHKALHVLSACYLLWLPILPFVSKTMSVNVLSALVLISVSFIISTGIICYMRGLKIARLFLIGWGVYEIAIVAKVAALSGLIPESLLIYNATVFGSGFECIILSLALADRINQLKAEQEQLQKVALEESEKSNLVKDEFLATISHELRTPMTGVEGALHLLEKEKLSMEGVGWISAAKSSAKNMTKLIDKVLYFSEIQSGKLQLNHQNFCIEEFSERVVKQANELILDKNIEFHTDINIDDNTHYIGDLNHITTIVMHIVDNAIKFTQKGHVKLKIFECNDMNQDYDCVINIVISDTGLGIPEDKRDRLFCSFRQIDGSFTRRFGGLGIGLAACKKLANQMGGDIILESEEGQGSTFIISLPLDKSAAPEKSEITQTTNIKTDEVPTVLIAEDNPVNQLVIQNILKRMGVRTLAAENGEEALDLYCKNKVDLVLMDCQMPIKDGFETTKAIRNLQTRPRETPIVAVTANAMSTDRSRCLEAGMNDYLNKPINIKLFQNTVQKWLPQFELNTQKPEE